MFKIKKQFNSFTKLGILAFVIIIPAFSYVVFTAFGGVLINKTLNTNPTLSDGLVGHWSFDGKDMISNVADSSGQGNHGSLVGQTSTTTTVGKIGQALDFDGVDDYVEVSDNNEFLGDFTISAWVFSNDVSVTGAILDRNKDFIHQEFMFKVDSSAKVTFSTQDSCSGTYSILISTDSLSANTWYHVTATMERGVQKKLYINGISKDNSSASVNIADCNIPTRIGSDERFGQYFDGKIDDVRIYNRALSASEITRLYQLGGTTRINVTLPSIQDGLVGHWSFDGKNLIDNATDSSGQGNNGFLNGFTSTTTTVGKIGQALDFDGVDDSVTVPNIPSSYTTYPFTLSAWSKFTGTDAGTLSAVVSIGKDGNEYFGLGWNSTSIKPLMIGQNTTYISTGGSAIGRNIWTHMVGVFRSPTDRELYVNGVSDATSSVSVTELTTTNKISIGSIMDIQWWSETVNDDVRVYNRALLAKEVSRLYDMGATTRINKTLPSIQDGLVGHWTFNGKDMINNINDVSGNGNDGFLVGQVSTTTAVGKIGQALDFDGVDDYVTIPFTDITGYPFTLSTWAKQNDSTIDTSEIALALGISSSQYFAIGFTSAGSGFVKPGLIGRNTSFDKHIGSYNAVVDEWVYITGVFKSATERELYINGVFDSEDTSSVTELTNASEVRIGTNMQSTLKTYGKVDDARIYNRALSAQEISRLYDVGR